MATAHTIQSSFLLGEVSPRWLGNMDKQEYFQSLKRLENGLVLSQGGVQKRPGTVLQRYTLSDFELESTSAVLAAVADFATRYQNNFRLFKYYTSDGKRWWIIAVNDTIDEWCVLDPDTGVLRPLVGDPVPTTATTNGVFSYNQWSFYTQATIFHSTFGKLDFSTVNLEELQIEQTGDVLLIVHREIPPLTIRYSLTRHFDTTASSNFYFPCATLWHTAFMPRATALADLLEYHQTIPLLEPNQEDNYGLGAITVSGGVTAIGGSVTLTSSKGIFTSAWVGTFIRLTDLTGSQSGMFYITTYTNSTTMSANLVSGVKPNSALSYGTAANTYWEESAWSPKNGYPSTVVAYGNRLLYMGTPANPNRIWCSAVGDIDELCTIPYAQDASFSTYLNDTSRAFYFDIIGAGQIQWAVVGKRIFVGADNKEFVIYSPDDAFGVDSYRIDVATTNGSAYRQPIRSSSEVLFVQRSGQRIRSIVFSFQEDDYRSQDITRLAEHIARKSIENLTQDGQAVPVFEDVSLQTSPEPRLWMTDNNGGLSACTFDREGGILGWSRHKLGGPPIGTTYGIDHPYVAALMSVPSTDGTSDQLVVLVKRVVAGVDSVTLEVMNPYFDLPEYTHEYFNPLAGYPDWMTTRAVFLDCAEGATASPATDTFTFADRANDIVSVVADGRYLGEMTLDGSGNLTLDKDYSEVLIGYKYNTIIETVDYEVPGSPSSNATKHKQGVEFWLHVHRTSFLKVKRSGQSNYQTVDFVQDANPSDSAVDLYTGWKRVNVGNVAREFNVTILHDQPLPFELLAAVTKAEV